jgi:hypothetical protein
MSEQTFLLLLSTVLVLIIVAMLGFLSAVFWQLVKILREVRGIMANLRTGSDTLGKDLASLRGNIIGGIAQVAGTFGRTRAKRKPSSKTQEPAEE